MTTGKRAAATTRKTAQDRSASSSSEQSKQRTPAKKRAAKKTAARRPRKKTAAMSAASSPAAQPGPAVAPPAAVAAAVNVVELPAPVRPATPEALGPDGRMLWSAVLDEFELGPTELPILEDACRERDLIDRLHRELVGLQLLVKGSMGQQVVNPLVTELRQHRLAYATLVNRLRLPVDAGDSSAVGRALANQRWSG